MEGKERLTGAGADAPTTSESDRTMPQVAGVEHRYLQLPGLRMHVALAGAGSPVVLLHGSPMHWWEWHKVIPELARHHRVICPDIRGMGWTDAPRDGYTRAQILADYVAMLDALGLDHVDLVSHDMGAIPAYGLCWEHPERIDRHVALSVAPLYMQLKASVLPKFRHLWHQEVLAIPGLGAALVGSKKQRAPRHMLSFPAGKTPWTEDEQEVFLERLREPERARAKSALVRRLVLPEIGRLMGGYYRNTQLQTPTKVLLGEEDPVFPPQLVRELLRGTEAQARHPVEVVGIPGAAHHMLAEAPDAVAQQVLQFLAR